MTKTKTSKSTVKKAATTAKKAATVATKKTTTAKKAAVKKAAAPVKKAAPAQKSSRTATSRVLDYIERHGEVTKAQLLDYYFGYVRPELRHAYKANPRRFRGYACYGMNSSIFNPEANNGRYMAIEKEGRNNIYTVQHI